MIVLAQVIAQVESGGDRYAMRFEPDLKREIAKRDALHSSPVIMTILDNIIKIHACSRDTAQMIAATSWGLYQILGENLYDPQCCNVMVKVGAFMAGANQTAAFATFTNRRCSMLGTAEYAQMSEANKTSFATRYNGPGNVSAYVTKMNAMAMALKLQEGEH